MKPRPLCSGKAIVRLAVFAGIGLSLAACGEQTTEVGSAAPVAARPAKIVTLTANDAGLKRSYPGTLEASEHAELAFRVGGQLIELPALAGKRVAAGDLLARLDPKDYRNTLAERQARFDLARTELAQRRELLDKKLSSQLDYDQANAEFKSAQAALEQARDNLRYSELKAPFDGIIARVDIDNFQPVQAQLPVIRIRSIDRMDIRFSVPETMIARLKRVEDPSVIDAFCGQVRFETHPDRRFRACHREHESVPDPLTRNYAAAFTLDKISAFAVLPGMTASIELDFSEFLADGVDRTVFAPVEAVFSEDGKNWLWRVDDGMTARRHAVELGRIEGDRVEIVSDIAADSRVIAAGVSYVREGMLVKPMVKQRGL